MTLLICFVLGIKGVAGRLPLAVEGDGNPVGLLLPDNLQQHHGETVDGIGRKALGVGEAADGVIGTVDVVVPVYEEDASALPQALLPALFPRRPRSFPHRRLPLLPATQPLRRHYTPLEEPVRPPACALPFEVDFHPPGV